MAMKQRKVKIGIIDSGAPESYVAESRLFSLSDTGIHISQGEKDVLGHGASVHQIIAEGAAGVALLHAQVFKERPTTTAAQVAAAVEWLCQNQVDLICMSLGLTQNREVLAKACQKAAGQDIILIASTAAQGPASFPAAYDHVIAATGDARCTYDEISILPGPVKSVFGAWCASPEQPSHHLMIRGASAACARLVAHVAQFLKQTPLTYHEVIAELQKIATYQGREYKSSSI